MYTKIVLVRSIMSNAVEEIVTKEEVIWSTWEELLLAFAVKRYGLKDWDTVAMELQNRRRHHHHLHHHRGSSLPQGSYTAQICKDKYRNLKRRFTNHHHDGGGERGGRGSENNNESKFQSDDDDDENDEVIGGGGGGGDDAFPWLEELRKLRVAELKQEVHRYDVSIRSLQIKVKTMEEERENSLKEDRNDDVKQQQPDLDDEEVQRERSENDNKSNNGDKNMPPEQVGGKSVSASAGNDENMSFNESNSAGKRKTFLKIEPENEPPEVKPDPHVKPPGVGGEDSCNDSSDRHEIKKKMNQEREKDDGRGDSDEFRDSVVESKEGTKESSDVQSSASLLTSKRKRRRGEGEDGGGGGGKGSTAPIKRESEGGAVKSEPSAVFLLLDKIRAHKHGSVFERRLQSQKTEKYKNTIRRHVDLETVQARIDDGSYSSCPTKFYVDLLLLFNNAIVFFPKASTESLAAQELREIVMKELKNNSSGPQPTVKLEPPKPELERSDSLLARHKSTNPSVVCRKRSSISAKASSSSANKVEKQKDSDKPVTNSKPLIKSPLSATSNEEEDSVKLQIKEKPVTGARSMRRSSKARTKTESTPNNSNSKSLSSQQHGVKDKVEAGKGDKKSVTAAAATVKQSSAADFLKRMKKNSPAKGTLVEALKSSKDNTKGGGKKDQQKKKLDKRKDGPVRRSAAGGGGNRKQTKEESSPSKRNIGRSSRKGKKEVVVSGRKRGRDGGEGEGSSKRAKKRSR